MARLAATLFDRGETARRRLTVTLPDGSPKDLTGATARWNLISSAGTAVLGTDKTIGDGVVIEGAAVDGVLVVTLTAAESAAVASAFYTQEWIITDSVGEVQIYRGAVAVGASVLPAAA